MSHDYLEGPLFVGKSVAASIQSGYAPDYNPDLGPSAFYQGVVLPDPRFPFGGTCGGSTATVARQLGWQLLPQIPILDAAPATLAANNIAASQTPTAGTALTLVTSTAAGVTVGQTFVNTTTNLLVSNLLVLDGAMATVSYGQTGRVQVYDPTKMISRAVSITSAGDDSGATFTVRGFDCYGQAMSETITGANATAANGKKAFKYIQSVTPAGTLSGSAVTVGTLDIFGFPLRVDAGQNLPGPYLNIWWSATLITATTGVTAAVTTNPATATTGDVRGTYAVQSASDGTKKLRITINPLLANLNSLPAGLVGVTQA